MLPLFSQRLACGEVACDGQPAREVASHLGHCRAAGHAQRFDVCGACGRIHQLASASPSVAVEA
jgi:hypothetical protein